VSTFICHLTGNTYFPKAGRWLVEIRTKNDFGEVEKIDRLGEKAEKEDRKNLTKNGRRRKIELTPLSKNGHVPIFAFLTFIRLRPSLL